MRIHRLNDVDTACAFVGASIFCSFLAQTSFTQQSELPSEVLCWAVLPLLSRRWPGGSDTAVSDARRSSRIKSSWLVAVSLTISCGYKAENGMIELAPLLVPLFLVAQRWLRSGDATSMTPGFEPFSPLVWATAFCGLVTTIPFSQWPFWGWLVSISALIPQLSIYMALLPRDAPVGSRQLPPLSDNQRHVAPDLCWKAVASLSVAMVVQYSVFGLSEPQIMRVLFVGIAKAMSWFFVFRTRQHVPWCVAPAIQIFSLVAVRNAYSQSLHTLATSNVVASALTFNQIIEMLPRQAKSRSILWVFLLASLIPYFANLLAVRSLQSQARSFSSAQQHPIDILVDNARNSFEGLVHRQSENFTAAQNEYRRRYKVEPPEGFEDWYNYAAAHQSLIIDDFDTIYKSISPFWKLSGAEIVQIMNDAQANPDMELWSCVHIGSEGRTRCQHPRRSFDRHISSMFDRLLGNLPDKLPDIKFLVNHLDEPRSLIPPTSSKRFTLTELSQQPVWDAVTKHCASQRLLTDARATPAIDTHGIPFVTNVSMAQDLCQHPQFKYMHGLLLQPKSFRLIEGQLPILTTGTLSTMGDILYPSAAYFEPEFTYDEAHDVNWEAKQNNLYWAGSTTGGFASNNEWRHYHRQRFVSLAQNLERKTYTYLQQISAVIQQKPSSFLNHRLFDVAFTKIFQCTLKTCHDQRVYFNLKPRADKYKAFRSRLAFDLDGNGISGRYYQLLASKSCPLKQTLLREWHDDRLVPWYHYIPISQSMEELPELVNYLTMSETGQERAKEIAAAGREWYGKAFTEVDFTIYVWRLLLEMARLQDPKRDRLIDSK